jgi:predicted transcriptional regulator
MISRAKPNTLGRREREIVDVLYRLERATVGQVLAKLKDKPSYSTVRAQLRVLEEKGHVSHEERGLRYVYSPTVPRDIAQRSALRHLVDTFFEGSVEKVVVTLLGEKAPRLSPQELDRLTELVARTRKENSR